MYSKNRHELLTKGKGNEMKRFTVITNMSHVDIGGARLWCHALIVDNEARDGLGTKDLRQIRGSTWGGLDVFTIWIDPGAEISFRDHEGGQFVMMSDDGNYNLDSATILVVDGKDVLGISQDDHRQSLCMEQEDKVPFGDTLDVKLFPYAGGCAYPCVMWRSLPGK